MAPQTCFPDDLLSSDSTVKELKDFALKMKLEGLKLYVGGSTKRTKQDLFYDIRIAYEKQVLGLRNTDEVNLPDDRENSGEGNAKATEEKAETTSSPSTESKARAVLAEATNTRQTEQADSSKPVSNVPEIARANVEALLKKPEADAVLQLLREEMEKLRIDHGSEKKESQPGTEMQKNINSGRYEEAQGTSPTTIEAERRHAEEKARAEQEGERRYIEQERRALEAERRIMEEESVRGLQAERRRIEEERARLEAERRRMEEERARLEAERQRMEEEQALEAERLKAERQRIEEERETLRTMEEQLEAERRTIEEEREAGQRNIEELCRMKEELEAERRRIEDEEEEQMREMMEEEERRRRIMEEEEKEARHRRSRTDACHKLVEEAINLYMDGVDSAEQLSKYFDEALTADPGNARALNGQAHILNLLRIKERGNEAFKAQILHLACQTYNTFLEMDSTNSVVKVKVMSNLGRTFFKLNMMADSLRAYEKGVELMTMLGHNVKGSSHISLFVKLLKGQAKSAMGVRMYEKARSAFKRALVLDPGRPDADTYFQLGLCLTNLGQCEEAVSYLHSAHEIEPSNMTYLLTLTNAQTELQKARAEQERQSSHQDPATPVSRRSLDHYAVLGVPRGASQAVIKKAYYNLIKEYHPDKHANSSASERRRAEQKTRQINTAYEVLSGKKTTIDLQSPARTPKAWR